MYSGTYVTTFSSTGTPLHKGGGVRPQPFFCQRHTESGQSKSIALSRSRHSGLSVNKFGKLAS